MMMAVPTYLAEEIVLTPTPTNFLRLTAATSETPRYG